MHSPEEAEKGKAESWSKNVSGVTLAVARQLSDTDPLDLWNSTVLWDCLVRSLARVWIAWPTERTSVGIKDDLHDGKLCLPPSLTLNNVESVWLPGIKQLVPLFECMFGGRGQGCRGGWV